MEEDSRRKPGPALSSFPDGVGEGIITLHLKEGQADDIMKELLPLPEKDCDPEASRVPKKSSSSSVSGISPCFKRKPFDWLVQKQLSNAEALMNKENYRVNAATKSLLNTELHYVKEFDKYLRQREMLELRKKELQYKKWLERVSVPLLKSIDNYTDQQSNDEIENRRRKEFDQYLDYRNKKGYAFLEIYNPSEYNPFLLQLCKTYLKVSTPPLHDPLLRQLRDRFEEEGIALQCETGRVYSAKEIDALHKQKLPLVHLRQKNAKGTEWLRTPLGFIESEVRQRSRQRMRGVFNSSSLDTKTWADSPQTPDLFINVGHKRKFPVHKSHFPATTKQASAIPGAKLIAI